MEKRVCPQAGRIPQGDVENFQITLKACRDCLQFSYRNPGEERRGPTGIMVGPQAEVWILIRSMVWG